MEETYRMSSRDLDRYKIIQDVLQKKVKQAHAARWLDLSDRQVRRILERVRRGGPAGLVHRLRGRPSHRARPAEFRQKVLECVRTDYADFGPTLACEYLAKRKPPLIISRQALGRWMAAAGLYAPRRRAVPHRQRRVRKPCRGELVQLDGSLHDWFEGRGPRCALIAYIDDATSRLLHAEFVPSEDTFHLFQTTKAYLLGHGRPLAFYVDRDSIYRVNRQATVQEELQDIPPLTQFGRAMRQLDIELLPAFSPQAKGRVERLFETLQDRLVKALRLAGISAIPDANRFLRRVYLQDHNARFARPAAAPQNAHRPLRKSFDLDALLAFQTPRVLHNDFTLRYRSQLFQLLPDQPCRLRPKITLLVEHRLDDSIRLRYKDHVLRYKRIPKPLWRPWYAKPSRERPPHRPGTLNYARSVAVPS
jgi:hypothetical protein